MYKFFAVIGIIVIGGVVTCDYTFRALSFSLAKTQATNGSFDLYLRTPVGSSTETVRMGTWSIVHDSQISEYDEGAISVTYLPTETFHQDIDQEYANRWRNSPTWSPDACPEAGGTSQFGITAASNSIRLSDPKNKTLRIDWFGEEAAPVRWIATPEKPGTYRVRLSWAHYNKKRGCIFSDNLEINGVPGKFEEGRTETTLVITVLTWAGIPITALQWSKVALGFFGFLLTVPFLQPILTGRFQQNSTAGSG